MGTVAYSELVKRVLISLQLKSASQLAEKLGKSTRTVEKWLAGTNKPDIPGLKNMRAHVALVNPVFAEEIGRVIEDYTHHGKPSASELDVLAKVVMRFYNRLILQADRQGLDRCATLRKVLTAGFAALSPESPDWKALGEVQAPANKEGHVRAESRRKAK